MGLRLLSLVDLESYVSYFYIVVSACNVMWEYFPLHDWILERWEKLSCCPNRSPLVPAVACLSCPVLRFVFPLSPACLFGSWSLVNCSVFHFFPDFYWPFHVLEVAGAIPFFTSPAIRVVPTYRTFFGSCFWVPSSALLFPPYVLWVADHGCPLVAYLLSLDYAIYYFSVSCPDCSCLEVRVVA